MERLILASASPRRKELLETAGIALEIYPSRIDENIDESLPPAEFVMTLAVQKAANVAEQFPEGFVLGADTIVALNGEILGKPKDEEEARTTLKKLSGQTHTVYTGVAIVTPTEIKTFFTETAVSFWELTNEEIDAYIQSGEPFDKAGSYGIQKLGAVFVKEIHGDYFSVVGLPISRTIRELRSLGFAAY